MEWMFRPIASIGLPASTTIGDGGIGVGVAGVSGTTGAPDCSPFLWNLPVPIAGDFLDGTVLLLAKPPDAPDPCAGLAGLGAPLECRECLDETDRFRRIWPSRATLSAPALAFDADLCTPDLRDAPGVTGVTTGGVPFCTS